MANTIQDKSKAFAIRIIRCYKFLTEQKQERIMSKQLLRCGTSIGANTRESKNAPDKGFEGERPEYKFDCDCRKPKPGLLLQAAKDFNIDLSQSIMIGDSERDVEAGNNAGCKASLLIQTNTTNALLVQTDSNLQKEQLNKCLEILNKSQHDKPKE